jgi:hypothetical protein
MWKITLRGGFALAIQNDPHSGPWHQASPVPEYGFSVQRAANHAQTSTNAPNARTNRR